MTFEAQEIGARTGRKVWLYTWTRGSKVYRYTSADRSLLVGGKVYASATISHDEIEQGGEIIRQNLDILAPMLLPVALLFRVQSPVDSVVLQLSEFHADDATEEVRVIWTGRVVGARWDLPATTCTLTHSPTYASMQRNGLRRRAQKTCPHVLYGSACGVDRGAFRLNATVATVSGVAIAAPGFGAQPDGYWSGGYISYQIDAGVEERRGIKAHTGTQLQLEGIPLGLSPGMVVAAFPGCDHTTGAAGCGKFDNLPRFGGFPNFPDKNPFGADPVY